jgi:hypothetical protein
MKPRAEPPKRSFDVNGAATYTGFSASWLRKKRLRSPDDPGIAGPPFIKLGSHPRAAVRYLREDLDRWLDELAERGRVAPDSEPAMRRGAAQESTDRES